MALILVRRTGVQFLIWYPGTCYKTALLIPSTLNGLEELQRLSSNELARTVAEITATGRVIAEFVGTGICKTTPR